MWSLRRGSQGFAASERRVACGKSDVRVESPKASSPTERGMTHYVLGGSHAFDACHGQTAPVSRAHHHAARFAHDGGCVRVDIRSARRCEFEPGNASARRQMEWLCELGSL